MSAARQKHRAHAARVATAAAIVVVALYAIGALVLDLFVAHRLTAEADSRIRAQLTDVGRLSLEPGGTTARPVGQNGGDLDDTPVFVWKVGAGGMATPLTTGAPLLPRQNWSSGTLDVTIGSTPFRLDAVKVGSNWFVAGQSVAGIARVRSVMLFPEVLIGGLALVATFVGALVVGLRASAPLDLVRRRQAEFTADASHELRTPLSVIEAEVDLALLRPRSSDEYTAVLQRVGDEGRRLRHIVDDLLWLARADNAPAETGVSEPVDVAETVAQCADRFTAVALRHGVTLALDRDDDDDPGLVLATPEWIDRLAGVLIDNACRYAGPDGKVEVHVRSTASRVTLAVDDSGPGIPPEQRSAVFDRFRRATSQPGGAGLGLAIADSVVRMTDGVWSVGQAPLGGARMEVSWRRCAPRRQSQPAPRQANPASDPNAAPEPTPSGGPTTAGGPTPSGGSAPDDAERAAVEA